MGDQPTIAEYFAGKSIFITGATGYMGNVLVEKLLRSCPNLKKVYLLMRIKRGANLESRLQKMLNIPVSTSYQKIDKCKTYLEKNSFFKFAIITCKTFSLL